MEVLLDSYDHIPSIISGVCLRHLLQMDTLKGLASLQQNYSSCKHKTDQKSSRLWKPTGVRANRDVHFKVRTYLASQNKFKCIRCEACRLLWDRSKWQMRNYTWQKAWLSCKALWSTSYSSDVLFPAEELLIWATQLPVFNDISKLHTASSTYRDIRVVDRC